MVATVFISWAGHSKKSRLIWLTKLIMSEAKTGLKMARKLKLQVLYGFSGFGEDHFHKFLGPFVQYPL